MSRRRAEEVIDYTVAEAANGVATKARKGLVWLILSAIGKKLLQNLVQDIIEAVQEALKRSDELDINVK